MEVILVVDDSPEGRDIAGECLREQGWSPLFARNGVEALEVVGARKPDAVLTDLRMPRMNGLELVEAMRRDHPGIPVVLMTAYGSEDTAVAALRAGALSYVPKKDLRTNLAAAMNVVMSAVSAKRFRERARTLLVKSESSYQLDYRPHATEALVSHLQGNLSRIDFCDETGLFQLSAALTEALQNAVEHGSLEMDSSLREKAVAEYARYREERRAALPYRDRRVHVFERCVPDEVTYVVRDEGPGFDISQVPDPRDPENLLKPSGRGILLMRTFMDEVQFNESGNEVTMVKRREPRRKIEI